MQYIIISLIKYYNFEITENNITEEIKLIMANKYEFDYYQILLN